MRTRASAAAGLVSTRHHLPRSPTRLCLRGDAHHGADEPADDRGAEEPPGQPRQHRHGRGRSINGRDRRNMAATTGALAPFPVHGLLPKQVRDGAARGARRCAPGPFILAPSVRRLGGAQRRSAGGRELALRRRQAHVERSGCTRTRARVRPLGSTLRHRRLWRVGLTRGPAPDPPAGNFPLTGHGGTRVSGNAPRARRPGRGGGRAGHGRGSGRAGTGRHEHGRSQVDQRHRLHGIGRCRHEHGRDDGLCSPWPRPIPAPSCARPAPPMV